MEVIFEEVIFKLEPRGCTERRMKGTSFYVLIIV